MSGYIVAGFAINALYSPWSVTVWSAMAQEWFDAQDDPEKLKAFVNLRLGETWSESDDSEKLDDKTLNARLERFPLIESVDAGGPLHWNNQLIPTRCCVLIGTADVQAGGSGRIEAQITGFGPGEESWLIAHEIFWGDAGVSVDPATGVSVWDELDKFFLREWLHESGAILRTAICLVDSGDQTDAVYEYVLPRQIPQRRVYACKGVDYLSSPGLAKEGTAKKHHVRLWNIATVATKDRLYSRLRIAPDPTGAPRPGYHHLPDWVTDEYVRQLTSERKIRERDKRTRRFRQRYMPIHPRNEALDLTVYAHGGLFILQNYIDPVRYRNLERIQQNLTQSGRNASNIAESRYPLMPPPQRRHRIISEGISL